MTSYKPKVLVVDDDDDALEVLRALLELKGFTVDTAGGVREMMSKFNAACDKGLPCFDLLIMDVDLPRVSGVGLLKAVRQVHPTIPVFLLSGYDLAIVKVRAKELRATYYVKPLTDVQGFLNSAFDLALRFHETDKSVGHARLILPAIVEEIMERGHSAA